jgi:molybdenum cofactor cytidylyltransferase
MPVPAIILAAGASRRLGYPKQLARIAGESLLDRTIRIVRASASEPILVVLGAHHDIIAAAVDLSQVHPVMNANWEHGISTSIQAGIRALLELRPATNAALFLVCDQPRLTAEHLRTLVEAYEQAREPAIVASQYAGTAGIPAIFPASQFGSLRALRGDAGARKLLRDQVCPVISVQFDGGEMDIDAPSDLSIKMNV